MFDNFIEHFSEDAIPVSLPHDFLSKLEEYLRIPFRWGEQHPDFLTILHYCYALALNDERYQNLLFEMWSVGRERIQMMIYAGIECGEFKIPKGRTVNEVALDIHTNIGGFLLMYATERSPKKATPYTDRLIKVALSWLE